MDLFPLGPEKKLLVIFIYFELLSGIALVIFTLNVRFVNVVVRRIQEYFLCEQRGHDPENPCSRFEIIRYGFSWVSARSYIIIAAYPTVNHIYAVKIKRVKELCSGKKKKQQRQQSYNKRSSVISSRHKNESLLSNESNF